jgi:hypothetical protein
MSFFDFTSKAQKIIDFVEQVAEKMSHETKFVQRQSKMTGSVFVKTLLMGWMKNPQAGLTLLCKRAQDFGVKISPQGLSERFNAEAVSYFKALFEHSLHTLHSKQPLPVAVLRQFTAILITDSSQVELPAILADKWKGSGGCASPAALKMHLTFDYLNGDVAGVDLTAGSVPDTAHAMTYPLGSLSLFDLGYFVLERFKQIIEQGAFFISRLRPNTRLFETPHSAVALDLLTVEGKYP